MAEKIVLTVKETAEALGICEDIVRDLVKTNGFPAIRLKRKILVNKLGLQEWLNKNQGCIKY